MGERLSREAVKRKTRHMNFDFCPQGVYDLVWKKLRIAVVKKSFSLWIR